MPNPMLFFWTIEKSIDNELIINERIVSKKVGRVTFCARTWMGQTTGQFGEFRRYSYKTLDFIFDSVECVMVMCGNKEGEHRAVI